MGRHLMRSERRPAKAKMNSKITSLSTLELLEARRDAQYREAEEYFDEALDGKWIWMAGKPVWQSSVDHGGVPERAIDENANTLWQGQSCTHTKREDNAWWKVD